MAFPRLRVVTCRSASVIMGGCRAASGALTAIFSVGARARYDAPSPVRVRVQLRMARVLGIVFYRAWGRLDHPRSCTSSRTGGRSTRVSRRGRGARSQAPVAGRGALHGPERRVHRRREHDVHRVGPVHRRHGPLCSALFSRLLLEEKVPAHTWLASTRVRGMGAADIRRRRRAAARPASWARPWRSWYPWEPGYWTFVSPNNGTWSRLSTSGLLGQTLALAVVFTADARSGDGGGYGRVAPLVPVTDDGGVAVTALVCQCVLVGGVYVFDHRREERPIRRGVALPADGAADCDVVGGGRRGNAAVAGVRGRRGCGCAPWASSRGSG